MFVFQICPVLFTLFCTARSVRDEKGVGKRKQPVSAVAKPGGLLPAEGRGGLSLGYVVLTPAASTKWNSCSVGRAREAIRGRTRCVLRACGCGMFVLWVRKAQLGKALYRTYSAGEAAEEAAWPCSWSKRLSCTQDLLSTRGNQLS